MQAELLDDIMIESESMAIKPTIRRPRQRTQVRFENRHYSNPIHPPSVTANALNDFFKKFYDSHLQNLPRKTCIDFESSFVYFIQSFDRQL